MLRRLIIRPGAIGDCVLALPALEFLRAEYTEVWVPSAIVPLIRCADRVRAISATRLDLLGLPDMPAPVGLVERLRTFDSIVSWYGANRPEFRDYVRTAGLPFEFLTALPDRPGIHCADFFAQQVGAPLPAIPRLESPATSEGHIVIHPFSGGARKNWPLQRYLDLADRLPLPVHWCAGPDEELRDAVRFDNLYELGCWLSSARLYIGNDSGITHLAAAAGAQVLAIFGPTDPAIWAPRGNNVRVIRDNLEAITVERVLNAIPDFL